MPGLAKSGEFSELGKTVSETGDAVCNLVEAAAQVRSHFKSHSCQRHQYILLD